MAKEFKLSDVSDMPFGPHKGAPMYKVPCDYLLRLNKVFTDDPEKPRFGKMVLVLDYIQENYERIYKGFRKQKQEYYKKNPEAIDREFERDMQERRYEYTKRRNARRGL